MIKLNLLSSLSLNFILVFCHLPIFSKSPLLDHFIPLQNIEIGNVKKLRVPPSASTQDIQNIIFKAVENSSSNDTVHIEFTPNTNYRLSDIEGNVALRILPSNNNMPQNIVFDGKGCTFTIASWTRFLAIRDTENIVIKNFKLTYEPKYITQGFISKIIDANEGYYNISIDAHYPIPTEQRFNEGKLKWVIIMRKLSDGKFGFKPGCPSTMHYSNPEKVGDREFQIKIGSCIDHGRIHGSYTGDPMRIKALEIGDKVAMLTRKDGKGAFIAQFTKDLAYRDITIDHTPASVFVDHYGNRNSYSNITVKPNPRTIFTTTADGIFVTNHRNGPWIENCYFQGIGDDAVVLKNTVLFLNEITENKLNPYRLENAQGLLEGDELLVYNMKKRILVSKHKVNSMDDNKHKSYRAVSVTPPFSFEANNNDFWIYNLSNQCNGFVLKNNIFEDHRRWGLLCGGANGSILNNQFIRSQNTAIYLVNSDNYSDNRTGAVPRNIEIIGNRFEDSWHAVNAHPFAVIASRMNGHIDITRSESEKGSYGSDWNGISNIRIESNHFIGWNSTNRLPIETRSTVLKEVPIHGIYLRDVSGASIKGNYFNPMNVNPKSFAIKINDFKNVNIEANHFHNLKNHSNQPISVSGAFEDTETP